MAQFGFENDIHSILKLDMPITNAPMMARWQRKGSSSNAAANMSSLSPGKPANASLSSSKTPSKTPGITCLVNVHRRCSKMTYPSQYELFHILGKSKTPSKMGGDRYIPVRNSKQMDVANYLLTKENEPVAPNTSVSKYAHFPRQPLKLTFIYSGCLYLKETQKFWSVSLNGYDINESKILHLGGQPLNAPEGNNLQDFICKTIKVSTFTMIRDADEI